MILGRYVYPIDLLELDDEASSLGPPGHLTSEQRLKAFEDLWDMLSPGLKNLIRNHIEHDITRERNNSVDAP
jgi:hypothetical protein